MIVLTFSSVHSIVSFPTISLQLSLIIALDSIEFLVILFFHHSQNWKNVKGKQNKIFKLQMFAIKIARIFLAG